ncbi:MAG: hypothetical protein CMJ83_14030 [Planctomycetes bacterium]|nr:hypothetical protein [Planctomycetota bacterium]
MSDETSTDVERRMIDDARAKGLGATLRTYTRLSGPGWLQSAITLGGGSLASALYLGVLTGYGLLWLQLVAMLLGVIMLSAISYVTLSTEQRPFRAICEKVNPVLGWGWILAVLMANLVWVFPQFSLGTAAITQNLLEDPSTTAKVSGAASLLLLAAIVIWFYDSGSRGIRIFEWVLKAMVGLVVLCFVGVVFKLGGSDSGLEWGNILEGFIPSPSLIFEPAAAFAPHLETSGASSFWSDRIVAQQRDVMIAAAATAVGINMTFLLPYSMLKKGWGRSFRGLAVFDLGTGLLVPFVLATSCVVIASSSSFHGEYDAALLDPASEAPKRVQKQYDGNLNAVLAHSLGADAVKALTDSERATAIAALPESDRALAAMLVKRDAFDLAAALKPLAGDTFARWIFGIGVIAMALSTIIILMLISGFTFCEIMDKPPTGWPHRLGCLAAGVGVLGPFVWSDVAFWLAVPTSVFGMVLLPVAYWTFILMMNSDALLGKHRPQGASRVRWNVLMFTAAIVVTPASLYGAWSKAGWWGIGGITAFVLLAAVFHRRR